MPRFFFHLATPHGFQRDETGGEFADVEFAYLDAREAALEIAFDMLREKQDPHALQFEIVDDQDRFLMDVPFSEVLRPRARLTAIGGTRAAIKQKMAHNRQLRADIRDEFVRTREVIAHAHATLQRSRRAAAAI